MINCFKHVFSNNSCQIDLRPLKLYIYSDSARRDLQFDIHIDPIYRKLKKVDFFMTGKKSTFLIFEISGQIENEKLKHWEFISTDSLTKKFSDLVFPL